MEQDEQSGNAILITWEHQPKNNTKQTLPSVYCIRTNQDRDEKTLRSTYTMLTDVEAVFRSLKSELGLRPVFHQQTDRVTGHLFISVLAYHLIHAIRYRLKKQIFTTAGKLSVSRWVTIVESRSPQNAKMEIRFISEKAIDRSRDSKEYMTLLACLIILAGLSRGQFRQNKNL